MWQIYNRLDEAEEKDKAEPPKLVKLLSDLPGGQYNSAAAAFFAAASAWSYSDCATFAEIMSRRAMDGPCMSLESKNDALLVDTKAHLFQSRNGRVMVLAVRGTEPTNLINWLMNASAKGEPFFSAGRVHGGFLRSGLVLWIKFKKLLLAASKGKSLPKLFDILNDPTLSYAAREKAFEELPEDKDREMAALYICGHSLGGALAALAGAAIHMDPDLRPVVDKLKGVYTYGQPMICDPMLADTLDEMLGEKVFRHNYEKDIVPSLPPRTTGNFEHFGHEYTSSEDRIWMHAPPRMHRQAWTVMLSNALGALAWMKEQSPLLKWLKLPYSWDDHSPIFYIRTSEAPDPGAGLL